MNWLKASSDPAGFLPGGVLEELRLALAERVAALNQTLNSLLVAPLLGAIARPAWFAAFEAQLTATFPGYLNHLDQGGDWHGSATPPAVWTNETISAATSAGVRLPAPIRGQRITPAWCGQQYEILNLLRWVRYVLDGAPATWEFRSGGKKFSNWTWEEAMADWYSKGWESAGSYGISHARVEHAAFREAITHDYLVGRGRATKVVTVPAALPFSVYMWCRDPSWFAYASLYENNDYLVPEAYWTSVGDFVGIGAEQAVPFAFFDTITVSAPAIGDAARGWAGYVGQHEDPWFLAPVAAVKYDVEGGFQYLNREET